MAEMKEDMSAVVTGETPELVAKRDKIRAHYGENRPIVDGVYDESCAVTCVNGTFVGTKGDGFTVFKGIPFVGAQPTGDLRWKAPVDYVPRRRRVRGLPQREVRLAA